MSVVTFGEIMLRLSPPEHRRISQASSFDVHFGGGEANVAVSIAQLGIPSRFASAVPDNEIGNACVSSLRSFGVDTSCVVLSGSRLGIYFLEHGASQRPSKVLYDRAGSAFAECTDWDWKRILEGAKWFHFTGITPALSDSAAKAVATGATEAKRAGATVSCDLNYRSKLWSRELAQTTMSALMPNVDLLIANEEDAECVFGIRPATSHEDVAKALIDRFGFKAVAISLRESFSASRNGWSGLLFSGEPYSSRPYEIDVIDRIGSGDAFAAGLIYAQLKQMTPQDAIEFATAAGCFKHSIPGDFNLATANEIQALAKGGGSGRVVR